MKRYEDLIQSRNDLWVSPSLKKLVYNSKLIVTGCGGNGVIFTIYAAHLGFRRFTLCDADRLEATNLNRYLIASTEQIGLYKTDIIKSYLQSRFTNLEINCINKPFPNIEILPAFSGATLIIGCLDNALTRIELDVLSRKHEKVLVDLGSGFVREELPSGEIVATSAGGQIILSRPGRACLRCLGFDLDATRNSYFLNDGEPEPSSLLLNSIIGSLAVEHAISEISGQLSPINRIAYDRESCTIVRETLLGKNNCQICGPGSNEHICSVLGLDIN